ncbi:hypothetical protein ACHAXR_012031 [Thalassiosira sp. AJA248-18]
MSPPRCDRLRLSLALIAIVSNASYTTIAPILPLEIDKYDISERGIALIFLAFSVGSSVAPPLVARHLESMGTFTVMSYSMVGMSLLFLCLGYIFDIAALLLSSNDHPAEESTGATSSNHNILVAGLLILLQFFMGAFFSTITTGYYSLATFAFVEKESAMSYIEAGVGAGYILGPVLGSSVLYDEMGYKFSYSVISMCMMVMAFLTWKFFSIHKGSKTPVDEVSSDLEAPTSGFVKNYNSFDNDFLAAGSVRDRTIGQLEAMNIDGHEKIAPTAISLLKFPKILFAATTIMWINVSWTFIEPLLAKRLNNHFHVGKKQIGLIFSLSNIIYVPTVFLVQYLPRHRRWRHWTISISTMLTPLAVLLIGSNAYSLVILGIILIGLLPTPVWIMLLPFMQDESTMLFPDTDLKRCVNDVTAGIYNSFMTLGQVVGYTIGPLMGSHGFAMTTQLVAVLIFLQSMLFYFCTKGNKPRTKRGSTC